MNDNSPPVYCHEEITLSKIDEMYPIAIPNQISTISMHISSWVNICWDLLKLLSWNETMVVSRQITLSKIDEICPWQSRTRSPQPQCTYQVWWKSIDIYSSYRPEMKILTCRGQITVKNWWNLPISKSQTRSPQYQCTYQVWWKSIEIHSLSSRNENTDGRTYGHTDDQRETILPGHYRVAGYKKD